MNFKPYIYFNLLQLIWLFKFRWAEDGRKNHKNHMAFLLMALFLPAAKHAGQGIIISVLLIISLKHLEAWKALPRR